MRIFVAGATGAVGRELVPAVKAAGHSVAGLTRSESKGNAIKRAGALPIVLFQLVFSRNLFGVLFQVIYLVIAVPVVYSRLSGIQLFR